MSWNCGCCGRVLPDRAIEHTAVTEEGDEVSVGSDCIKKIVAAGNSGHQHQEGPVLFSIQAYEATEDTTE